MTTAATISIDTADGLMPSYAASPEGTARGGILVIQEAFGVTTHIEDIADRLAADGWYAIAPAFFHRQGSPVFAYDDLKSVMPAMGKVTGAEVATDVSAALAHLNSAGFEPLKTGVVGFCMGGSVTFHAAVDHAIGAAVTFYGGGLAEGRFGLPSLIDAAPGLKTPWLGLYGDLDKGIPAVDVEDLRYVVGTSAVESEIVRYPEADHGFNCTDRPAVFHPESAADAWQRTLAWFGSHLTAA
jgi:carboxymethylenebutenolidase